LAQRLAGDLEVSGGFGRAFRVPVPQERYFALERTGQRWVGGPTLVPTTNTGVNASLNYRHRRATAAFTVSDDRLANFITLNPQHEINIVPGIRAMA
jgi:iron complex outermembrane recepter protein